MTGDAANLLYALLFELKIVKDVHGIIKVELLAQIYHLVTNARLDRFHFGLA